MPRKLARGLLVLALASQAACGAAHVIQRTQSSGVIELEGDHDKAMEQASEQMVAHCGDGNFTIVFDGPEPQIAGKARSWQLRYQCGDGPAGDGH